MYLIFIPIFCILIWIFCALFIRSNEEHKCHWIYYYPKNNNRNRPYRREYKICKAKYIDALPAYPEPHWQWVYEYPNDQIIGIYL